MDQTQLQEQIALHYSKLSPNAQQAFSSMAWMETLQTIGTRHDLNIDQIKILGTETTMLLLGSTSLEEYMSTLFDELHIKDDLVEEIITEIHDSILSPILSDLDKAHKDHVDSLIAEKYGNGKILDERFSKLPKEVQEAITESNYQQKLYEIASQQNLSIEQMGVLEETTNKVLLNIIHPDKYEDELRSKINLPPEKVGEIIRQVNDTVIGSIRTSLRTHWEEKMHPEMGEDEVPLPPYALPKVEISPAKTEAPKQVPIMAPERELPGPSKDEAKIYQSAGIEMLSGQKNPEKPEDDIMKSIIGAKLSGRTQSKPILSDHSVPKMSPSVPPQASPASNPAPVPVKSHDPYKEAI